MIMRKDLKEDGAVKKMQIITAPNTGTNFELKVEQANHINKLWEQKRRK